MYFHRDLCMLGAEEGTMLKGKNITTLLPQFFEENASSIRSEKTRRDWRQILTRLERTSGKRVNEYTAEDLRDFILHGGRKSPSPNTISTYRTCLRAFFSWAAYAGIIENDPSSVLNRMVRVKVKPVKNNVWLTEDEINALFEACHDDPDELVAKRDAIAIGLMVLCGLRVHEVAGLNWENINLRRGSIDFIGKGQKPGSVAIPPQLVEMLFEWRGILTAGSHFENRYRRGELEPGQRAVLLSFKSIGLEDRRLEPRWGFGLGIDGIRDVVKKRGARVGIPELDPHDLRRSFAGLLEEKGVPIREISKALRHESVATTERYLADNPKKWRENITAAVIDIRTRRAQ